MILAVIPEIPEWSVALDIDHPSDLETARSMWPWAEAQLAGWHGKLHFIDQLNGHRA